MDNEGGVFMVDCKDEYSKSKIPLRDWFAGMALQGTLASFDEEDKAKATDVYIAEQAYIIADAMLEERKK